MIIERMTRVRITVERMTVERMSAYRTKDRMIATE
jgi:hypothetical protein